MGRKLREQLEWITGLAVVISLIVLIVEVRSNTKARERQVNLDAITRISEPFLEPAELLAGYERVKALDGWEAQNAAFMEHYGMEPSQAVAWVRYLILLWGGVQADFVYSGPTPELEARVRGLLGYPDNQLFWSIASGTDPEFEAFIESVVPGATDRAR
jgi:hypothetical protein